MTPSKIPSRSLCAQVTGLFHHGYDDATKQYSCCAWGRANGWLMMSHVEALRIIPASHPQYATALAIFQAHAAALAAVQDKADGRWHQVSIHTHTLADIVLKQAINQAACSGQHLLFDAHHPYIQPALSPLVADLLSIVAGAGPPRDVPGDVCDLHGGVRDGAGRAARLAG